MFNPERRDFYAGLLALVMGLFTVVMGLRLQVGTLTRMGPGFFPTVLGALMALLGVVLAVVHTRQGSEPDQAADGFHKPVSYPDPRGAVCIVLGIVGFIVLSRYAGLLPATFFCVFVAAMGDRSATPLGSALLAASITAFGMLLFSYVLQVQIPVMRGF